MFALLETGWQGRVVAGDLNFDLIETYKVVRDDVGMLIRGLKDAALQHMEDFYYQQRAHEPTTRIERAVRFIYINKAGFNGLWRVNKAGKCNVPFGHNAKANICDTTRLLECSASLRSIDLDIECRDFATTIEGVKPGDVVYFDSPYVPVSKTANFTGYAKEGFGAAEQQRLADLMKSFEASGVSAVLSNSDCEETRRLYQGLHIESVQARRAVNSDATKRGPVGEIMVTTGSIRNPDLLARSCGS